jgi:Flp pilus assembly protein TadG
MRLPSPRLARFRTGFAGAARRFGADTRGTTAVEFGMLLAPFLLLVMGIITIGIQYLTMHFLEYGVEVASRKLRTGEAQKAGQTLGGFRDLFCDAADVMINCDDNHLVIHIKNKKTFAELTPLPACVAEGGLAPPSGNEGDSVESVAGGASDAVVVLACYEWGMGMSLWQSIWNLIPSETPTIQGKIILSAATAFRSEPYE